VRINEVGRTLLPGTRKVYAEPGEWLNINTAMYGLLSIAMAIGWLLAVRQRMDLLMWTVPFYMAFLLIWPFEAGTRYMAPMLPMLVVCLWKLIEPLRHHRYSILLIFALAHLAVTLALWTGDLQDIRYHRYWPHIDQLAAVIGPDRDNVGSLDLDDSLTQMIRLQLDRHVMHVQPTGDRPQWVIGPTDVELDGYTPIADAGELRLLKRRD
jgi:hypothetical protein